MILRIQDLPVEVLQEIAIRCEPTSLFNFNVTCKVIRHACHVALIYLQNIKLSLSKAVTGSGAVQPLIQYDPDDMLNIDSLSIYLKDDPTVASKYALAVGKALQWDNDDITDDTVKRTVRHLRVIPHLRVFGYVPRDQECKAIALVKRLWREREDVLARLDPSGDDFDVLSALWAHESDINFPELTTRLTFCMAIESLNGEVKSFNSAHRLARRRSVGSLLRVERNATLSTRTILMLGVVHAIPENSRMCDLARAQWIVAALAHDVRGFAREPHPYFRPPDPFPTASTFQVMNRTRDDDPPVPFCEEYDQVDGTLTQGLWQKWLLQYCRTCLPNSSTTTWCGYSMGPRTGEFGLGQLEGSGAQGDRSFAVQGVVGYDECTFTIAMMYNDGIRCSWRGNLTPFGIAGRWHNIVEPETAGFFWLWKRDRPAS